MATLSQGVPSRAPQGGYVVSANKTPISKYVWKGLFWLLVALILVYTIFPFYWMVVSSLKADKDLFTSPLSYVPSPLSWSHMEYVFDNGTFLKSLRNSFFVAATTVLLALVIGASAAYAIGRLKFRGKTPIMYLILSMTMFPQIAVLGSLFQIVRSPLGFIPAGWASDEGIGRVFGWLRGLSLYDRAITVGNFNTHVLPALVLTYLIFTLPFTVWTLTNFFRAMPGELEEASYVDGATPFQTFYKVLLPLAGPGMVTTGLLAFIAAWNEFLFALSFTQQPSNRTVNLAIFYFSGSSGSSFEIPWGQIMAATVIVTVPIVILVLIFQRRIIAGLTAGAVKG